MIFAATERLVLRRPRPEDLEPLIASWSEPEMTRYTDVKPDVRSFLAGMIADMQAKEPGELEPGGPWYQFIAERKEDGALVGDLGVGFGLPGHAQVELGYRVLPAYHRLGYGREAVAGIISFLIERHRIHRFVGVAAEQNAASVALLRSLGFRQEGHFRQSFLCHGEWIDDVYFALLAEEWAGIKPPGR
jgi:RimJ/RimL family protein N-acetyltransferase